MTEFSVGTKISILKIFLRDSTHFDTFDLIYNGIQITNDELKLGALDPKNKVSKFIFHVIDQTKQEEAKTRDNLLLTQDKLSSTNKERSKLKEQNGELLSKNNSYYKRIEELEDLVEKYKLLYNNEREKNFKLTEQIEALREEKSKRSKLLSSFKSKEKSFTSFKPIQKNEDDK